MIESEKWRDFDISFNIHPIKRDLLIKEDLAAVKQQMFLLLHFGYNDIPFHPEIGTDIRSYLFDSFTELRARTAQKSIELLIRNFVKRVDLIDVLVAQDRHTITIDIIFKMKNSIVAHTYQVYLKRIQ